MMLNILFTMCACYSVTLYNTPCSYQIHNLSQMFTRAGKLFKLVYPQ